MNRILWFAIGLLLVLMGDRLLRKNHMDGDEGTPWNFGDPDCAGYRPDLTQEQRNQAAAEWRAEHGESK